MRAGLAVAASVGGHALAVAAVVFFTRTAPPEATTRPVLDTRVILAAAPAGEDSHHTPTLAAPVPDVPEATPPTPSEPRQAPPAADDDDRPPVVRTVAVPSVVPAGLIARVRATAAPRTDPDARPAAGVTTPARPAARPAHGALAARQRVVYLLDASGSMGEWGKFDAARAVLAATVGTQPATVSVKVVAYSAVAEVVGPAALRGLAPGGRGDHLVAVQVALAEAPDFVVWFTDADDLPVAAVRAAVRRSGRPVVVMVARVGPNGVAAPVELR